MIASTDESGAELDLFPRLVEAALLSDQRSRPMHHDAVMRRARRRFSMVWKRRDDAL